MQLHQLNLEKQRQTIKQLQEATRCYRTNDYPPKPWSFAERIPGCIDPPLPLLGEANGVEALYPKEQPRQEEINNAVKQFDAYLTKIKDSEAKRSATQRAYHDCLRNHQDNANKNV